MRPRFLPSLLLLLLLANVTVCNAQRSSLGGLYVGDTLARIFQVMSIPDSITADRGDTENEDQADLFYRAKSAFVSLVPDGDEIWIVFTMSPSMATNDGLKVGDSRAQVEAKRGMPERVLTGPQGARTYLYTSQGIVFIIDGTTDAVSAIAIAPPLSDFQVSGKAWLPGNISEIVHRYQSDNGKGAIVGRMTNSRPDSLHDIRLGVTLIDKQGRVVDVIFVEVGSLLPHASIPFKVSVPVKGNWSDYRIDIQALDESGSRSSAPISRQHQKLIGKLEQAFRTLSNTKSGSP